MKRMKGNKHCKCHTLILEVKVVLGLTQLYPHWSQIKTVAVRSYLLELLHRILTKCWVKIRLRVIQNTFIIKLWSSLKERKFRIGLIFRNVKDCQFNWSNQWKKETLYQHIRRILSFTRTEADSEVPPLRINKVMTSQKRG